MIVYGLTARASRRRRTSLASVGMARACILLTMPVYLWGTDYGAAAEMAPPKAARSVHLWYPAPEGVVYHNEVTVDDQWELVWADEFNYEGLADPNKWDYETGFVRNREKQYYTKARPENARVEGGTLIVESRKEEYEKGQYTSASLHTWHKAEWLYGRIEVRAKLPTGRGMWPAIWMLGTNRDKVGWPACGEIDIMENVGFDPNTICANIHTRAYNHVKGTNKGSKITCEKPSEGYHVYAIEWYEDRMDFFLDGKKYFTFTNEGTGNDVWPYDKPHYLILNAAIGGSWGGQKGIDDTIFPQKYCIDYVRVFKRVKK